jgi:hypothetical protein
VGFEYGDLTTMLTLYNPQTLGHGNNRVDGEEVFFISNPGLGLWAYRGKLLRATHDLGLEELSRPQIRNG